jgi:predicted porin
MFPERRALFLAFCGCSLAALLCHPAKADENDDKNTASGGISIFGNVDVGLTYQTHGTPPTDQYPAGNETVIMKNSNKANFALAQNGSSSTNLGIKGYQDIGGDWSAVFKADIGFSPLSGQIYDGLKALSANNGVPLAQQRTGGDNGRAGQVFNGDEYFGVSSRTYGTLTFGRNPTLVLDDAQKFDPMGNAPGTALIGILNSFQGMGDTEDYRPDGSVKYTISGIGPLHFGALWEPNTPAGTKNGVEEIAMGADYGDFSSDFTYNKNRGAIAATTLTAAQMLKAPAGSIAGTVSDNTTYSAAAKYHLDPLTFYAAWQHIYFANPSNPLPADATTIGSYVLGVVNNSAYNNNKVLTIWWAGLRYQFSDRLTINSAYYQYRQNSYLNDNGCTSSAISAACAGTLNGLSVRADYLAAPKFYVYAGTMYSYVTGGYAYGYLHNNTVSPVVGIRYSF